MTVEVDDKELHMPFSETRLYPIGPHRAIAGFLAVEALFSSLLKYHLHLVKCKNHKSMS